MIKLNNQENGKTQEQCTIQKDQSFIKSEQPVQKEAMIQKEQSFIKDTGDGKQKGKLFQNKTANKALIALGIIIVALTIACVIFVNVPVGA